MHSLRTRHGGRAIRVVFLLQRAESWANVSPLWVKMRSDPRFEPHVWLLPYNQANPELSRQKAPSSRAILEKMDAEYAEWPQCGNLSAQNFDVAVLTAPYDRERPPAFHFRKISKAVPITLYVPYGIVVGGGAKNTIFQYGQLTQRKSSVVIARSFSEKQLYERYCPEGASHVHVTGLPRFDTMQDGHFEPDPELISAIGERKAILWNSHFSFTEDFDQSANYSTFDRIGPDLFRFALSNRDLALIWRPHPGLLPIAEKKGLIRRGTMNALLKELSAAGIIFDDRPDHRHAFHASKGLITDAGSFLIEYLLTGKPLMYLQNPEGEGLNEEAANLLNYIEVAETPDDVTRFIKDVMKGRDRRKCDRQDALEKFVPMLDGRATDRVIELLLGHVHDSLPAPADESLPQEVSPNLPLLTHFINQLEATHQRKLAKSVFLKRLKRVVNPTRARVTQWIKDISWGSQ